MEEILINILNNMEKRIIFADNKLVIRYLNKAAKQHLLKKGLKDLEGKSLLKFHKDETNKKLLSALEDLQMNNNLEKVMINTTTIYAVRDEDKNLIGIYEMY